MRLLILSQYFTPEVTAASLRLQPFAEGLARRGHQVLIVCEVPNHPSGIVEPSYRGHAMVRRRAEGFDVRHVWVRAPRSRRARARLASYASYAAAASVAAAFGPRPDVVLASSPPLSVGAVGRLAAARHRVPWVLDVRDLWPEAAVALGQLSDPRALRWAERLERSLYASATEITTTSEPFRATIADRAGDSGKVSVVPNGTTEMWLETGRQQVDRAELGLPSDRFVWSYAGNLGLSQALDPVLEAADRLGDGFQLVLIGDGPARERLRERAERISPGRVVLQDVMEPEECARWLRASDAVLVSLADDPALAKSVPIKLYDSCAVGRPVILAAKGEVRRLAAESEAALIVEPERPQELAEAVRRLAADPDLGAGLAESAVEFATANVRSAQVERLEEILERARRKGR